MVKKQLADNFRGDPPGPRNFHPRALIETLFLPSIASLPPPPPADCPNNDTKACLNFTNTVVLHMVNETDPEGKVEIFEGAVDDKLDEGWLGSNFDLPEALKPPPPPSQAPSQTISRDNEANMSVGAIVGIVAAALCCILLTMLFGVRRRPKRTAEEDNLPDGDRQQVPTDIELARDGFDDQSLAMGDDASSITTQDVSYSSQEHLLRGQHSSTADVTPMPVVRENVSPLDDESEMGESVFSDQDQIQNMNSASSLASMAAMSTLVASVTSDSPPLSPASMEEYSVQEFGGESTTSSGYIGSFDLGSPTSAATQTSTARAAGMASPVSPAAVEGTAGEVGGVSAGAAAAIGAAGAGVLAVGAYAATRRGSDKSAEESPSSKDSRASPGSSKGSSASSSNPMDDLDSAIEAGNWGQVGALAAILASKGLSTPTEKKSSRSVSADKSQDSSAASGTRDHETSLDRARAAEIDKLVDAGDWQGVVLAAARFEADQTYDAESYSASASNSSRWTGSATSANTRSIATGESANVSNHRGQEEIRAEVEALVRRVVPEEADNINEMMTQFKGREEELVETLRRMQERAIASRARLAVQKSAKLEARIKKGSRGAGVSSGQSVASASSTKSELEQAVEAGDWKAVGAAAQKMSDSSVGELSVEEKARLRDAISQAPAFARQDGGGSDEDRLDQLIEQGDWQGVIAAAKRATEGPDMGEQDALAQANMWQEIADQSKVEARQGKSATCSNDVAIHRIHI